MNNFDIILGTAMWGWAVEKKIAFSILDEFCSYGYNMVDTATNYPLDKNPAHYMLSVNWLIEWSNLNPSTPLKIIVKLGSIDNSGSSEFDLNASRIQNQLYSIQNQLAYPVYMVSTHWDNRGKDDLQAIGETIESFLKFKAQGYKLGLSGIKQPQFYAKLAPEISSEWHIQVKENIFTRSARENYLPHFKSNKYYAYGINSGGVELAGKRELVSTIMRGINNKEEDIIKVYDLFNKIFPDINITNFNQMSLLFTYSNPSLSGLIFGPRTLDQLISSMNIIKFLKYKNRNKYYKIYNELLKNYEIL